MCDSVCASTLYLHPHCYLSVSTFYLAFINLSCMHLSTYEKMYTCGKFILLQNLVDSF
jgi:hypothetical protein